jgi:hypothetical protein
MFQARLVKDFLAMGGESARQKLLAAIKSAWGRFYYPAIDFSGPENFLEFIQCRQQAWIGIKDGSDNPIAIVWLVHDPPTTDFPNLHIWYFRKETFLGPWNILLRKLFLEEGITAFMICGYKEQVIWRWLGRLPYTQIYFSRRSRRNPVTLRITDWWEVVCHKEDFLRSLT